MDIREPKSSLFRTYFEHSFSMKHKLMVNMKGCVYWLMNYKLKADSRSNIFLVNIKGMNKCRL